MDIGATYHLSLILYCLHYMRQILLIYRFLPTGYVILTAQDLEEVPAPYKIHKGPGHMHNNNLAAGEYV